MSDASSPFSPLLEALLSAQITALRAQEPFWKAASKAATTTGGDAQATEKIWETARQQREDWLAELAATSSGDDIPFETLRRMLDPAHFLGAGSDEINRAVHKLIDGQESAGFGTTERQVLNATREWLLLCQAGSAYRLVMGMAWIRAFGVFVAEMRAEPGKVAQGPRALTDRWLEIANDELIATQRSPAFLDAQRDLLRAGVAYRQRERELIEGWCEARSIPTRSEIDDMHLTLHLLRRQIREMRKQMAEMATSVARDPAVPGKHGR